MRELLNEKVRRICDLKNLILEYLYHKPVLTPEGLLRGAAWPIVNMIEPYVCDVSALSVATHSRKGRTSCWKASWVP